MPRKGVLLFADSPYQNGNGCTCGSRRLPALEDVANRPIAHHVLDAMLAAGIDELVLTGSADALIDVRACLTTYQGSPGLLNYVISDDAFGAGASLRAAAEVVGAAPCVVHVGDGLLDQPLRPYVQALHERSLDAVLLCQRPGFQVPTPGIQKPPVLPSVPGLLCDAGVGIFGPGALREACQADSGETPWSLGELAQQLSDVGGQVQVSLADGWRRYRGNPVDLLEVNRLALELISAHPCQPTGTQNRIEGRVQIDRTATVTTSVIVGPVVVGEGAQVTNAYVGPYTSIGAGARIEGVEIERSIISPGASVMHVGGRLVSSLVGRGAHVFRDFSLPRAIRLRVGEGNEVALC
jgi:glucose-1-phosphate thymidylyltransferase